MSQATDYDVANASGASVRADLNTILLAIASLNAGTAAPSTTYANMLWVDTTNSLLKKRNNANSAWVQLGPMDNRLEGRVPILTKSAGYTAAAADRGSLIDFTTAGVTLAYTAAATLGADWYVYVRNSAASGLITHDPNSTEQIDGATTVTQSINDGLYVVVCDGTGFKTSRVKDVTGDSGSGGVRGLVPAPAAGDAAANKYLKASGAWSALANTDLPAGTVIDRAYAEYTANTSITAVIPWDDTIPQNTEGTQILSVSITPKKTTSRVRARFHCFGAVDGAVAAIFEAALFRNSTADALAATETGTTITTNGIQNLEIVFEDSPGSTSAQTYNVRVGVNSAGNLRVNGNSTGRHFGGVARATLVLEEIAA